MTKTKPTKYSVTDSKGQVHTRKSPRTYTHAVVVHFPATPPSDRWPPGVPAYSKASWCGRLDLAHKAASGFPVGVTTEIIEVGA